MADPHEPNSEHPDEPHDGPTAELHQLPCVPDPVAMRAMMDALFRHAVHGLIELAWTTPAPGTKSGAKLNNAQLFGLDDDSRDGLIEFACELNARQNTNLYTSAGLRHEDADRRHRHGNDDVISVTAIKADCDSPGCFTHALEICEELGMRPSFPMFTGRDPHLRGSLWWVLEQPVARDEFAAVEQLERRIAQLFGSDPSVVDPSRVMRLAGSVAWPLKKGRVLEMTGVYRPQHGWRAAPYTLEELQHAARSRTFEAHTPPEAALDFNTAKPVFDVGSLLGAAGEPGRFHERALPAVMSLISRGVPGDAVLELVGGAISIAGVNVEQRRVELADMVRGAVRKVELERVATPQLLTPQPEEAAAGAAREPFPLIAMHEMGLQGPPEWRIDKLVPKRGFGVIYGESGTFKSFIAIDMGLRVAHGRPWCGLAVDQAPVCYIAGEGTFGIQSRVMAWLESRAKDTAHADATEAVAPPHFWLAPVASNFLDPATVQHIARRLLALDPSPKLLFVDTLARSFGGGDENKAQDMNRFIAACDYLQEMCGAFVMVVHHSGKDTSKGERGSNTLRGAADVRFQLTRGVGDMAAVMKVEKQKDGEDGQRYRIRMVKVDSVYAATGEVVTSLAPVTDGTNALPRVSADGDPGAASARLGKNEYAVTDKLADGPQTFATLAARTGLDRRNLGRSLRTLFAKGRVAQDGNMWQLISAERSDFSLGGGGDHDDDEVDEEVDILAP